MSLSWIGWSVERIEIWMVAEGCIRLTEVSPRRENARSCAMSSSALFLLPAVRIRPNHSLDSLQICFHFWFNCEWQRNWCCHE